MSLPRALWRVEWDAARHPDRPNDRRHVVRHFTAEDAAQRQARSVLAWPMFMDLEGVWVADGLDWRRVEVDECPI